MLTKKKGAFESATDNSADAVALSLSGEGEEGKVDGEGTVSASTSMYTSSTRKKPLATPIPSDTDMDIFDTIMGASLET